MKNARDAPFGTSRAIFMSELTPSWRGYDGHFFGDCEGFG